MHRIREERKGESVREEKERRDGTEKDFLRF